ncbi:MULTISPECIES: heavy metal translocating P-type ATPase [Hymenobacter]|uniref:heavy metal translocating P-type ATPase n=1 Tax=unclassified Hymenobacter TaxID=2615202 RepID=UPI0016510FD1|nr:MULTISPECIES: heavy metal translocating P-type ATPase [unclassified Hymenobacter]MBC6700278.1 cadmium-translocating P-type ATPase [Hymenobacter sp. BT190]MCR5890511.1 cadmium-translocating P-type ATPase [Hymenobacter sp. J193]MCR5890606.1 cadmium-translocating P-type ATPase [Hymenobacter sp. J193]
MPDPTSPNTDEELNTAKQAKLENVGALSRDQLTPEAAAAPEGHDVPGHDHSDHEGHDHPAGKKVVDLAGQAADEHAGHDHASGDDHDHGPVGANPYLWPGVALALLLGGLALDYYDVTWFTKYVRLAWYGVAFLLVGWKVMKAAVLSIPSGNVFNEFLLMSIATLGAFAIGEYPEGVAVMLFYTVGELFQDAAVNRAKRSIRALLEIQATEVTVIRNGQPLVLDPKEVVVGDTIEVKPGEKVALDGTLTKGPASFNTAALTGESVPQTKQAGEAVLAGMVNLESLIQVAVTAGYKDTKLARILAMVQDAVGRKAKTQQFITKFAKVYTPIVVALAVLLVLVPYFVVDDYVFRTWLYRALVFLVISCPCALVISIPLGYFGGIGAASKAGILFKGSNFLDVMRELDTVVMDKTGTLTQGVFAVQQVQPAPGLESAQLLRLVGALETKSTHPIAKAVVLHVGAAVQGVSVENVEEISGHGMRGKVDGKDVLAGNTKLLTKFSVPYPTEVDQILDSIVVAAVDGKYAGYVTVADSPKEDAARTVQELRADGITKIVMLSGDKDSITQRVAKELGIDEAHGGLLPEDKARYVQEYKDAGRKLAFVGDGVNDAPVVALADVGIAMGGLGSDATIETADVVIQTDHPSKIATARRIARATHSVVWQNIWLAFIVKGIVLILGAGGLATMWEAVFADVGVALLAILNAVRIQRMDYATPGTGGTPPAAPAAPLAQKNLSVVESMPRELREGPHHHSGPSA